MKLYYLPGACTLATKISLVESGQAFEAIAVDRTTKQTADGKDYNAINPKGYVPTLVLDDGRVLTENVAVLSYVASLDPTHRLAPRPGDFGFYRLLEWLGFINCELHKNMSPLFRAETPEEARAAAHTILARRLAYVEESLGDKPYLMGEQFTVADAYLYVVLSWKARTGIDLSKLPRLTAFFERCRARPSVQQVRKAEGLPP